MAKHQPMQITVNLPTRTNGNGSQVSRRSQDKEFDTSWAVLTQRGFTKKKYSISRAPATPRLFCVLLRSAKRTAKKDGVDPTLKNFLAGKHGDAIRGGIGACCDSAAFFGGTEVPFPMAPNHELAGILEECFKDPASICPDLPKGTKIKAVCAKPKLDKAQPAK